MSWIAGAEWQVDDRGGSDGDKAGYKTHLDVEPLSVVLYTDRPVGPSLLIHCRLLIQLLAQFYTAKKREIEHADQAHIHAVHETGARVTHDIKNLLQSLKTTASAISEQGQEETAGEEKRNLAGLSLLRRQLPNITQRLQLALDKLQRPAGNNGERMSAQSWWHQLTQRHSGSDIMFHAEIETDCDIPNECFDSVVENLLDNARNKSGATPKLEVQVDLEVNNAGVVVCVTDNGEPLPTGLAKQLFQRAVPSNDGLGIGLYQAYKQADSLGYELSLSSNEPGAVQFSLVKRPTHN
jgi:signal transduction histidine kinase